jgi:hypothetical protein
MRTCKFPNRRAQQRRLCLGYIKNAADKKLATAVKAERRKSAKYNVMAKSAKAKIVPFVIESFGGFGACASEFVAEFVRAAKSSYHSWCPHEIVFGLPRDVSAAVMRGNALMASAALQR